MRHFYILVAALLWGSAPLMAQQVIQGNVFSAVDSIPLESVTIRVGDTLKGITDSAGRFRFNHSTQTPKLRLSLIGYEPSTVTYRGEGSTYYLKPVENLLEEVTVSTGYQQIPKARATGSFEVVDSALFHRQISTDVLSRLDGIASGLLFDKRDGTMDISRMSIRGLSTLTRSTMRPLVIVDDFPYEGDLNNINPNDVKSVTLLKDAAAASIWGARAGNGVLVLTTKHASFGTPLRLSATANVSFQKPENLFYQPQMRQTDFIDVERFLFDQGFYDGSLANSTNFPVVSPVVEILSRLRDQEISETEANEQIDYWRQFDIRDDLREYFYRNAVRQQYGITLSGGGAGHNVYASVGYDKNMDNKVGNEFSRTTFKVTDKLKPLRGLELETRVQYTHTTRKDNHPGAMTIAPNVPLYPYARLADDYGNPLAVEKNYRPGFIDTAGNGLLLDWRYRPLEELYLADNSSQLQSIVLNMDMSYRFFPWMSASVKYQYQRQNSVATNLQSEALWNTRDFINRFTVIENEVPVYGVPRGSGLSKSFASLDAYGIRGQLDVSKDWNGHTLNVIAGSELRSNTRRTESYRTWGYDEGTLTSQPVNVTDRLPLYLGGSATIPDGTSFYGYIDRFVSLYANGAYNLMGRYTVSGSMRKDASNLFGASTNNRWKPLWSLGAAWTLSEERWFNPEMIPYLKWRLTYGHSGNVNNIIPAITTIQYSGSTNRFNGYPFAGVVDAPNPSLRWENVATLNMGMDFSLKHHRISGSLEYYIKNNTDLISSVPYDPTTGFRTLDLNVANLRTKGLDLNLSGNILDGPLMWKADLLFSYNTNRVLKYFREMNVYTLPGATGTLLEGYAYGTLFSHRWAGLDPETGDPRGYLGGKISKDYQEMTTSSGMDELSMDDIVMHGSALPTYFGAFRHAFTWKGVSLSTNISYRFGYYFFRDVLNYSALLSGRIAHADYYNRWQRPGDEKNTSIPSLVYPNNAARQHFYQEGEVNVEKGDHLRIQDVMLNYRLQQSMARRFGLQSIHVTLQASNLNVFIWRSNKKDIDPDYRGIPIPPSFSIGFNIQL